MVYIHCIGHTSSSEDNESPRITESTQKTSSKTNCTAHVRYVFKNSKSLPPCVKLKTGVSVDISFETTGILTV